MRLSKPYAVLAVLLPAAVTLLLTTRTWVVGEARDVLSAVVVTVVAVLGLLTGGRIIRAVSGAVLVLAALGAAAITLLVALRPVDAVSAAVARELARTTAPAATGVTTATGWAAVVAAGVLVVGALLAAVSSRGWGGLSSRYDRGVRPVAGPRGQVRNAWDELSDGGDPTLRDAPDQT